MANTSRPQPHHALLIGTAGMLDALTTEFARSSAHGTLLARDLMKVHALAHDALHLPTPIGGREDLSQRADAHAACLMHVRGVLNGRQSSWPFWNASQSMPSKNS